nr:PE domain-containing protein [Mycobacterium liflandii]
MANAAAAAATTTMVPAGGDEVSVAVVGCSAVWGRTTSSSAPSWSSSISVSCRSWMRPGPPIWRPRPPRRRRWPMGSFRCWRSRCKRWGRPGWPVRRVSCSIRWSMRRLSR